MTNQDPRSYVVCGTPRVGGYMLCLGLHQTGVCGFPDEYFGEVGVQPRLMQEFRITVFPEYLETILQKKRGANGVFGLKLHWDQLVFLTRRLNEIESFQGSSPAGSLARLLGETRYIHLSRRDRIRQAVSWLRALQTNCWIHPKNRRAPFQTGPAEGPPHYDHDRLCGLVQAIETGESSWKRFFAENAIEPLEIVYEDMVDDYENTIHRVLKYLGLDQAAARRVSAPPTKRQFSPAAEQWIYQYKKQKGLLTIGDRLLRSLEFVRRRPMW